MPALYSGNRSWVPIKVQTSGTAASSSTRSRWRSGADVSVAAAGMRVMRVPPCTMSDKSGKLSLNVPDNGTYLRCRHAPRPREPSTCCSASRSPKCVDVSNLVSASTHGPDHTVAYERPDLARDDLAYRAQFLGERLLGHADGKPATRRGSRGAIEQELRNSALHTARSLIEA